MPLPRLRSYNTPNVSIEPDRADSWGVTRLVQVSLENSQMVDVPDNVKSGSQNSDGNLLYISVRCGDALKEESFMILRAPLLSSFA